MLACKSHEYFRIYIEYYFSLQPGALQHVIASDWRERGDPDWQQSFLALESCMAEKRVKNLPAVWIASSLTLIAMTTAMLIFPLIIAYAKALLLKRGRGLNISSLSLLC